MRRDTVEAAQRAGLVDDRRFALQRAEQLASRGSGDLLIGDDLERQGVPPELVRLAIAALEPEADRADTIVGGARHEPENGSLPRVAGILGGSARNDHCESGC